MKQVFINLLSNAIKYNTVNGAVAVEYRTSVPGRIRVCVRDSGEGLSADKLAQLFQPFNRLGQEANGEEGTGIGLVMTKRLIEMMGGVIGAESTVGKGSVFWIEIDLTAERHAIGNMVAPLAQLDPLVQANAQLRTLLYETAGSGTIPFQTERLNSACVGLIIVATLLVIGYLMVKPEKCSIQAPPRPKTGSSGLASQ